MIGRKGGGGRSRFLSDMSEQFAELKSRLLEVSDLEAATSLLHWDQSTYMPPGGAEARGRQIAVLSRLAHEKFTDAAIGDLLAAVQMEEESAAYESDTAALIRV